MIQYHTLLTNPGDPVSHPATNQILQLLWVIQYHTQGDPVSHLTDKIMQLHRCYSLARAIYIVTLSAKAISQLVFLRSCSPSNVDYFNLLCVQGFHKLLLLTCLVRTEPICLTFTLLIIIHLSSCQFFNINKMPWFTSKPALHLHASFPVNCNALKRNYKICRE